MMADNQARDALDDSTAHEPQSKVPKKYEISNLQRFCVIEVPGTVNDPQRAIDALGGLGAIESCAKAKDGKLKLSLRPGDPYSHPLVGAPAEYNTMLLKVTRRRNKPTLSDDDVRVDLIGKVQPKIVFQEPADFQFHPGLPKMGQALYRQPRPEDDLMHKDYVYASQENDMLPPMFCTSQPKNLYNFQENLDKSRQDALQKGKQKHVRPGILNFDATEIPTEPETQFDLNKMDKPRRELSLKLKEMFKERKIWSLKALELELGMDLTSSNQWLMREYAIACSRLIQLSACDRPQAYSDSHDNYDSSGSCSIQLKSLIQAIAVCFLPLYQRTLAGIERGIRL
eukprot:TRINITY_DN10383_c0_g1_i3.p1 TRINITY_DN10383_c0_g1~~TRINITY_DN10383_c0_g1_i3.p1  ORF type:complete len:341 (+),score=61.68 TRINITY_DN10383_c0_g1_i3:2-1024(+)